MPTAETTTRKKRKSRTVAKRISVAKAEEEKQAAIEAALEAEREAHKLELQKLKEEQEERDFGYESDSSDPFGDIDDDDEDISDTSGFFGGASDDSVHEEDIFVQAEAIESAGRPVVYYIKKDGNNMGSLPHPCSWDILRDKWGGGIYKIEVRDANSKQYIKGKTERVAGEAKDEKAGPVIQQPVQPGPNMDQMFNGMMQMFQQMQEMVNKERRAEERDEKRSNDALSSTMLSVMQTSQQNSQEMFLRLQENTNRIMEKLGDNFSNALEKQDDKMNKMFERLAASTNKKEEFTTMELIQLMNNSENKGMEVMKMVLDMAEARAESLAEAGGGEDTKESLLVQTMKGFLPLLSKANQAANVAQAYQAQAQPVRGALPQGRQQAGVPQGRSPQQTQGQRVAPPKTAGSGVGQAGKKSALGLPSIADQFNENTTHSAIPRSLQPDKAAIKEGFIEADENEAAGVRPGIEGESADLYEQASATQKLICEIAIPSIASHMLVQGLSPKDSAALVLSELQGQQITPQVVVKEFPLDLLMKIARSLEVDSSFDSWLGDFHAEIQIIAGDDATGAGELPSGEANDLSAGLEG